MFDFSFGELGLIAIVALVVLGPERLPKVARTAGFFARKARASWQSMRQEIERELQADDLKQSLGEARRAAADLHRDLHQTTAQLRSSVENPSPTAPVTDAAEDTSLAPRGTRDERA